MQRQMLRAMALAALMLCAVKAQEVATSDAQGLGLGLINQDVRRIAVRSNIRMDNPITTAIISALTSNGGNPFRLTRDLEIYNAVGGRLDLDIAFLAGFMKVKEGVTVTLKGFRILRAEGGLPTGMFSRSPGAILRLEDCESRMLVCAPPQFINALFFSQNANRPIPGTNCCGPSSTPTSYNVQDVAIRPAAYGPGNDLGDYIIHWVNSQLTCDQVAPWTDTMQSVCGDLTPLTNPPSPQCMGVVFPAVSALVCQNPACINACRGAFNTC